MTTCDETRARFLAMSAAETSPIFRGFWLTSRRWTINLDTICETLHPERDPLRPGFRGLNVP